MKITHASRMRTAPSYSTWLRDVLHTIGCIAGWTFLMLTMLLTAYETGWTLFAVSLFGSTAVKEILPDLPTLWGITIIVALLVARFIASRRAVGLALLITFSVVLIAELIWTQAYPEQSLFWARQLAWGDSTVKDYERFPVRAINNAAPAFRFQENLSPELFQTIEYRSGDQLKQMPFEEFLRSTQTTSFIVIKDDAILYEGYFNGYKRDSVVTSFSMAKSITSALIGIAIDEGYIGSVNDLLIKYVPELKGKGLDDVALKDLLLMSSGIRYRTDDEVSPFAQITQFTDDGLSYSYPNLRSLALRVKPDGKGPGAEFNYNNYNPILLGLILERTTGRSPSEYLQEKIWKPLGMEYPASWDLDSEKSGFELMLSGINARAIDFAKFGRLLLNYGDWNGTQIISPEWVVESTSPDPNDHRLWHSDVDWKEANGYYKYQWWGRLNPDGSYDYVAQGHLGQRIYVSPQEKMIIVRFGTEEGGVDEWADVFQSIIANVKAKTKSTSPVQAWPTSTPEEQGFDSDKIAEGLLAIKENGTLIHSLMVIRNDKVILDAYFYPYDGSIYHDLASVTKSVMTTLIGIAADQGKLNLDDKMVSFFPDREIANRDERKEKITIGHLASMSSGLECAQDDEITMIKMRATKDWIQFALDLPVVREPGTRFAYCSVNMHLLSAILQKATGMSALEFARQNLFGPLGIQDVYWPADPQGVTHGWGDLCLYPADMARFGSLFLHEGQWEGKQIVSREWVKSALHPYMTGTGRIEDYGYGWWIGQPENEPEFLAAGNGGQKIKVYPRLNMIIVTTGGGFEYSEIEPYLLPAMGDRSFKALPSNPVGFAKLNAALIDIAQGPQPEPVPPLPAIAKSISGQTFIFEDNPILRSLRLDFDNSAEAILQLEVANEPSPRVNGVGLDGIYRSSHAGRPILARGSWTDDHTFVMDYNEGPGISVYKFRLHFDGDQMTFVGGGWNLRATRSR